MINISKNFKKVPWVRRVHPDKASMSFSCHYKPHPTGDLRTSYVELTSENFLNELSPAAHPINSRYMSTRPIWGPSGKTDKKGREEMVITGFDELESVSLGWQLFISGNKIAHLTGSGVFDLANETMDNETYSLLLSWMDASGVKQGLAEAVSCAEHSGDSGILLYQTSDDEIDWEVYAAEKGHTIYPQEDADGNTVYYIQYSKKGKEMCDIISNKTIETWMHADPETVLEDQTVEERVVAILKSAQMEKSEDGWVLVRRKEAQVGSDMCQFVYFRVPDVSWGPVELTIEAHENAASYVANEVKDTAFPLLVLKSEKVTSLPPTQTNAKTIAIKGTSDSLAHSDAKFAAPPDASNIATIHFKELNENILRASHSVIIAPDIMKQGADSSTAIKILFRPEIEWAQQRWACYYKPIKQLVKVMKRLVGKIEKKLDAFGALRTSIWQNIWIPQNEKELTDIVTSKVYARVLSRRAALNELGSQYKGDYEQINKEWEEELAMKQKYGAKLEDDVNPDAPKINNQDPGKTITE
jgi:hypothetical protein